MKLLAVARTNSWALAKYGDAILLVDLPVNTWHRVLSLQHKAHQNSMDIGCMSRNWSITTFFSQYSFPIVLRHCFQCWNIDGSWEGIFNSGLYILLVSYSFEGWVWSISVLFHLLCIHSFYTFICFVVAMCFQGSFVCVCISVWLVIFLTGKLGHEVNSSKWKEGSPKEITEILRKVLCAKWHNCSSLRNSLLVI